MALTETYLELAPEFGGTRFGPFTGMEVRLGSDPAKNDIVLPENLGVLPEHVKLINQGDGSFIVAPVDRTAGVFVYRAGSGAKQVTSPVAVQSSVDTYSADSFALVTSEGPRFYVLSIMAKTEAKSKESAFGAARKRLSGRSLWSELKRQGLVLFLTNKSGQQLSIWFAFVKNGTILRPRYLIAGAAMLAGWIFAGGFSIVACSTAVDGVQAQDALGTCKTDLSICNGGGDDATSLETYVARLLGDGKASVQWKGALKADQEFNAAFRKELANLVNSENSRDQLRWVYRRPGSDFARIRNEMKRKSWPDELIRVMAYTAATKGRAAEREWVFLEGDSLGDEVCARGPMAITWRQAMNLKLSPVAYTTMMSANDYGAAGDPEKAAALRESAATLRNHVPPEADGFLPFQRANPFNDNTAFCIYADEDISQDPRDRENMSELITQLGKTVGPSARGVPSLDANTGGLNRLIRFYAADYNGDFNKLDLSSGGALPSSMLNDTKKVKDYALSRAAETLAKAVVIPCLARLDPNYDDLPLDKTIETEVDPLHCINVFGIVEYNL